MREFYLGPNITHTYRLCHDIRHQIKRSQIRYEAHEEPTLTEVRSFTVYLKIIPIQITLG